MSNKRTYEFKCLGITGNFVGPADVEDIERIVGKPGICQEMFMQDYTYQDRNKQLRESLATAVASLTGVARKTKTDDKGKESFTESEQEYINRLMTTKIDEADTNSLFVLSTEDLTRLWHETNNAIGEWSPGASSSRKPAAVFYAQADDILGKIAGGYITADGNPASAARTTAKLEAFLQVDFAAVYGDFNRDNLARALRDKKDKEEQVSRNNAL